MTTLADLQSDDGAEILAVYALVRRDGLRYECDGTEMAPELWCGPDGGDLTRAAGRGKLEEVLARVIDDAEMGGSGDVLRDALIAVGATYGIALGASDA